MNHQWAYCLNEEQYNKLYRIIAKIPGFLSFMDMNPSDDLTFLTESYKNILLEENRSTPGARANLALLNTKYIQYRFEYKDQERINQPSFKDFDLDHVLSWPTRPRWADNMAVKEIDYLDHFIPHVPGLSKYLFENSKSFNLYDLVAAYQMKLNATGQNNPDINFALETIKERFYRIMDDHDDAIHYVNHSHQIDDHKVIAEFLTEAAESFYLIDLEKNICSDFTTKYLRNFNPYIASECFMRFFRANHVNIALHFAKQTFAYIFSSPNIYWHNKEAIYGCANILNSIVYALGNKCSEGIKSDKHTAIIIETLYLLLSRIIYWTDKETFKDEQYDDEQLPIQVQHKLRAYRLRANLIQKYGSLLVSNIVDGNVDMMCLSDLRTAHFLAFSNRIVGNNSIFLQDAIKIFHEKRVFTVCSLEQAAEKGYLRNDSLSQAIHAKYKSGQYSLSDKDVYTIISDLRAYFQNQKNISVEEQIPLSYLVADNFSPSYKPEKELIRRYLQENGIEYFYHVTDRDRLKSIIKFQGLLSYKRCLDEGVVMPIREDMARTRDVDAKVGLEDYARLSFKERIPKIEERLAEGGDLVMLKISAEVALFENTEFTDIEATTPGMHHGNTFNDLRKVDLRSVNAPYESLNQEEKLKSQAEVLVKGIIPLKYIMNVKNPTKIS